MRARILAIFILIIFIVLPLSLYWYFTTQKVATLMIRVPLWTSFRIELIGSFWVDGLPLADKFLSYQKDCTDTCIFSPILPARYTLTLTSSGKTSISDTIIVNSSEQIIKSYLLTDDIIITPVWSIVRDESLAISLMDNATVQKWWDFTMIGTDIKHRVWVIKNGDTVSQIWFLSSERFSPIRSIRVAIQSASLGASKSVLILNLAGSRTLLLPIDISSEREIATMPNVHIISVVPADTWRIQTNSGTLELRWDSLTYDIRFTNSIDISPQVRIGYIDKKDTKKLSLANLPLTHSVLVRLDRGTGMSVIVRNGLDIESLFFYNGIPAYLDRAGLIFTLAEK